MFESWYFCIRVLMVCKAWIYLGAGVLNVTWCIFCDFLLLLRMFSIETKRGALPLIKKYNSVCSTCFVTFNRYTQSQKIGRWRSNNLIVFSVSVFILLQPSGFILTQTNSSINTRAIFWNQIFFIPIKMFLRSNKIIHKSIIEGNSCIDSSVFILDFNLICERITNDCTLYEWLWFSYNEWIGIWRWKGYTNEYVFQTLPAPPYQILRKVTPSFDYSISIQ